MACIIPDIRSIKIYIFLIFAQKRMLWVPTRTLLMSTVNVVKFFTPKLLTKWQMQTQTRLLLQEQSDQGLYCLPFQ